MQYKIIMIIIINNDNHDNSNNNKCVCVCVYTNTPYCPANIVIYLTLPSNRFAPDRMGVGEYSMDGAGGHLKTLLVNIN
jgi:hypothetical protein